MPVQLPYGDGRLVTLDWSHPIKVRECSLPQGVPLSDPADATRKAVESPLDYPPLSATIVPGDRVVLAVEPGVPQAAAIVAGVIQALLAGGVAGLDITVLSTAGTSDYCVPTWADSDSATSDATQPTERTSSLLAGLPAALRTGVEEIWHRPDDAGALAYLAATDDADPIYLNRRLCDADLVVSIGVQRLEESVGYLGLAGAVYPTFSDVAARQRLRAVDAADWRKQAKKWRQEASHTLWLLGAQFVVQVVPGLQDAVLHVVAGQVDAVARRGQKLCAAAWRLGIEYRVGLVVAAIDGSAEQQTWDNVARALSLVERIVAEEGAIVLCTQLDRPPSPLLRSVAFSSEGKPKRGRRRECSVDSLPVSLIEELGRSHRVYLMSDLEGDAVEEIGCAPLASPAEIQRLSKQFDTCIVVSGAQYAGISVESADE